jgi:endonuclease I
MKKFYISILFLLPFLLFAQEPNGYYDSAIGKSGNDLRSALYDAIKGHTDVTYKGLWDLYQTSDTIHIGNKTYIWDMYSMDENGNANYYYTPGSDQCGNYKNEGDCYNREHSVPKSWFNDASPMFSDAFHIVPTDGQVNGRRGNNPFGEVGTASWTSTNGSKLGSARSGLGHSGTVFEPVDAYKGDFARGYFYMATRYMDQCSNWGGDMFGSETGYPGFRKWAVEMLLEWHRNDPVNRKEINRNNEIYKQQHNRNPFIDHPELAEHIWGNKKAEGWKSATGTNDVRIDFTVYPTPASGILNVKTDESDLSYKVYSLSGQQTLSGQLFNQSYIDISDLTNGIYMLELSKDRKKMMKKFVVVNK